MAHNFAAIGLLAIYLSYLFAKHQTRRVALAYQSRSGGRVRTELVLQELEASEVNRCRVVNKVGKWTYNWTLFIKTNDKRKCYSRQ